MRTRAMSVSAGLVVVAVVLVALGRFAIALIVLGVAALVSILSLRRRFAQAGRATLEPVAVPPEEVELEEGPVSCCMRCGSIHVRHMRLSEGLIPGAGEMLTWICARCQHRGSPLHFDDATAYRQFIKGLNEKEAEDGDEGASSA